MLVIGNKYFVDDIKNRKLSGLLYQLNRQYTNASSRKNKKNSKLKKTEKQLLFINADVLAFQQDSGSLSHVLSLPQRRGQAEGAAPGSVLTD